jgi:hypothetical protein
MFPQGNSKLTSEQRNRLMQICEIKDSRTFNKILEYLKDELDWLWFDNRTKNYNFRSFSSLCSMNNLDFNYGHEIKELEVKNFDAWLGGVIFNMCRIFFWRKKIKLLKSGQKEVIVNKVVYYSIPQKGKGCVRRKGTTDKALSFSSLLFEPAPIALNGICIFFSLDKSKVNRLKKLAEKHHYLKIEHCQEELNISKENMMLFNLNNENEGYAKFDNGKVILVKSDLITPTNLTNKSLKNYKK